MSCKKKFFLIGILFLFTFSLFAQKVKYEDRVNWKLPVYRGLVGESKELCLFFEEAQYDYSKSNLPFVYKKIDSPKGVSAVSVEILKIEYEELTETERSILSSVQVDDKLSIELEKAIIRKQNQYFVKYYPVVRNSLGQIQKVSNIQYEVSFEQERSFRLKSLSYANQSLLANGDWYKVATTKKGVCKLTYSFFKKLGMDIDNIDPRTIRMFGFGGGMLPELNSVSRPDDLVEIATLLNGEEDGSFDKNDYLIFFGESQVKWSYNQNVNRFEHKVNRYSDTVYYFINVGDELGKRIALEHEIDEVVDDSVTTYDDYAYHEIDERNLIKSGQLWLGEVFDNKTNMDFIFDFPGIVNEENASVEVRTVARAGVNSKFTISVSGVNAIIQHTRVPVNSYEGQYAEANSKSMVFKPNSSSIRVNLTYSKPQLIAKGWLDYININVKRNLAYTGSQVIFRNVSTVGQDKVSKFNISSNKKIRVWDVSDHQDVKEMQVNWDGSIVSFVTRTNELKEFVAFENADSTLAFPKGKVPNQNLHAMPQADMIIVSHPMFIKSANRLANIHRGEGLSVNVATSNQVYNEFSSGSQDPIAIRMFSKMFYDRANSELEMPKYLLLFGDASYDFKDRTKGNTNFVVSYESENSLNPVFSYISDDFMALLDSSEGTWEINEKIDLGVGRLPVKSISEAEDVVNKIESYYSPSSLGDWRNNFTFIGDDGDGNMHSSQADDLTRIVESKKEGVNIKKIYLDAFQRENTPSGTRYPTANKEISRAVEGGSFIVNYTGHGGETGWSKNRVLDVPTILSWNNINRLAIFVTATCEFSRFDDPLRTSAGELVLLNPNGGAIALFTTTRLVYAYQNFLLNSTFYHRLFNRTDEGSFKRLGELARQVKNSNSGTPNTRNFTLLGDPALRVGMPDFNVVTTFVNGKPTINTDSSAFKVDTVNALSTLEVKGHLVDYNGKNLDEYNGIIYPTIFDKKNTISTLGNGGVTPMTFSAYNARIFKGKVTVKNGKFDFKLVIPKDISYEFGKGKLTYYSDNNLNAANGEFKEFIIGGSNDSAITDNNGPEIELYLNDRSFVYGGITNDQPVLLADLSDELGLNTVGNGIGHDIVAIIDEDTENTIVLNDYYEANVDDYKAGEIRFPLDKLSEGKHTLTLKAWDVANNSSQKTIEFNVVNEKDVEIQNLVNYPNPFTTNTEFIFQHNQPGIPLDVKLEIFTVSGKLVKSFDQIIVNEGFLSRDIRWDGRDEFGDRIAKGVYVYKLKIRSGNGSTAEKIEKLVIL